MSCELGVILLFLLLPSLKVLQAIFKGKNSLVSFCRTVWPFGVLFMCKLLGYMGQYRTVWVYKAVQF